MDSTMTTKTKTKTKTKAKIDFNSDSTPAKGSLTYPMPLNCIVSDMFKASGRTFEEVRSELYKKHMIKSSYDSKRVVLYTNRRNYVNDPINRECNGVVLDRSNYNPLVIPSRTLRYHIKDNKKVNNFIKNKYYNVYRANDGTVFNMYYFEDHWVVSTVKGYDMNDVSPNKTHTYQQLITDSLNDTHSLTWEQFTEGLDTTKCYSFGFKNKTIHKFSNNLVWFIQSVSLTDYEVNLTSPFKTIHSQQPMKNVGNIKGLYKRAVTAYDKFKNDPENINFGYIFRSTNTAVTGNHSDLFVESSLMKKIKEVLYDSKLHKSCNTMGYNLDTYIKLNSYLNASLHEQYCTLFPNTTFHKLDDNVNKVIKYMIENSSPDGPVESDTPVELVITDVGKELLNKFNKNVQLDFDNDETHRKRILTEYVKHPDNINELYKVAAVELVE